MSPDKLGLDQETLSRLLDDLLERYLNHVDQYQALRQNLTSHLSGGYLALAQANFSNPNRIRYGQEFYDERMQALTHLSIKDEPPSFETRHSPIAGVSLETLEVQEQSPKQLSTDCVTLSDDESYGIDQESSIRRDPLRWFGILVPPSLRASQSSFKSAVIDDVPLLASIMKEMKELEIDIKRTRKRLRRAR